MKKYVLYKKEYITKDFVNHKPLTNAYNFDMTKEALKQFYLGHLNDGLNPSTIHCDAYTYMDKNNNTLIEIGIINEEFFYEEISEIGGNIRYEG